MDQVLVVAWLALLISLVVAFAVVFRRATRVVAVARADDGGFLARGIEFQQDPLTGIGHEDLISGDGDRGGIAGF